MGANNNVTELLPLKVYPFILNVNAELFFVISALYSLIDKVGPSISNLTVFVGMNGSSEDLGLNAGNTWAFTG